MWGYLRHPPVFGLQPAAEQGEWFGEDRFFGAPGQSAVRYESDFVPSKPRTDLILNAVTYSPSGFPQPCWQCGIGVASREGKALFHKHLQVTGERFWHRTFWRWRLSDPKACTQVPIRYELAFGGGLQAPADPDGTPGPWIACCEQNPIGVGLLPGKQPTNVVRPPRIEDPRQPITDPHTLYPPQGFGFIIDAPDQAQWRVYFSWRVRYPLHPAPSAVEAMLIEADHP